ncbi:hypothetical protein ACRAWD_18635 [Caulobacter segnis]
MQGGAYGEHQILSAAAGEGPRRRSTPRPSPYGSRPAPARGLTLRTKRYTNAPTLSFPWDRA